MHCVLMVGLLALAACRTTLDEEPPSPCDPLEGVSDLATIETQIFAKNCNFSGCHGTGSRDSELQLVAGESHAELVGQPSTLEPDRMLVVPGDPQRSYLLYMVEQVRPGDMIPPADSTPPTDEGFMPGNSTARLCTEKRDALQAWIEAGAPNN